MCFSILYRANADESREIRAHPAWRPGEQNADIGAIAKPCHERVVEDMEDRIPIHRVVREHGFFPEEMFQVEVLFVCRREFFKIAEDFSGVGGQGKTRKGCSSAYRGRDGRADAEERGRRFPEAELPETAASPSGEHN